MRKEKIFLVSVLMTLTMITGCRNTPAQNTPVENTATVAAVEKSDITRTDDPVQESELKTAADRIIVTDSVEVLETALPEAPVVSEQQITEEIKEKMLKMMIGNTAVAVEWENNESVHALEALCAETPLVIQMSMYGGFEQVGPIGTRLPSSDAQTTTSAGDIVLYSSNQIVVFYGSNSWAYTKLGHATDRDAAGMAALLGNGNVTITISMEEAE